MRTGTGSQSAWRLKITEDETGDMVQRTVPASSIKAAKTGPSSVFELGASMGAEAPTAPEPAPAPAKKRTELGWKAPAKARAPLAPPQQRRIADGMLQPTAGLACAIFNTGELLLETAQGQLRLNRDQARDLVHYLERLAGALREPATT